MPRNLQLKPYTIMKKGVLLVLLVSSIFAHGQTLKDALFSGKLKTGSGGVIRKGDDLASKMDTSHNVASADTTAVTKPTSPVTNVPVQNAPEQMDSAVASATNTNDGSTVTTDTATEATPEAPKEAATAPRNNNTVWKQYADSVASAVKTEVLSSKKIKRGSYYVLVSYVIDTTGQVEVSDVFVSPENSLLQQQVKERLNIDTPHLDPVLNSTGKPRKVTKKYNFTLVKD